MNDFELERLRAKGLAEIHAYYDAERAKLRYADGRPFRYTRGRLSIEMTIGVYVIKQTWRGLWWLLRGSAYGIGLCLRGQLRVPLEGWRSIGRGAVRVANSDAFEFIVLEMGVPLLGLFATIYCLLQILLALL